MYSPRVCIHLVYVFTSCMYSPRVCIHLVYVFTSCMYSPRVCIHLVCVFTSCVYSPRVCIHLVCVFTSCMYSPRVCIHLVCVFTSCMYSPHVCIHLVFSPRVFTSCIHLVYSPRVLLLYRDFDSEYLMCDCHLEWIVKWMKNNAVRVNSGTTCAVPSQLKGRSIKNLKRKDLHCGKCPDVIGIYFDFLEIKLICMGFFGWKSSFSFEDSFGPWPSTPFSGMPLFPALFPLFFFFLEFPTF